MLVYRLPESSGCFFLGGSKKHDGQHSGTSQKTTKTWQRDDKMDASVFFFHYD